MDTKRCSHCHEEKSLVFFYRNASHADGLTHECKTCHKKRYQETRVDVLAKKKAGYQPHPRIREPVTDGFKRCQTCGVEKEATTQFFSISRTFVDGLERQCRLCKRARTLATREQTKVRRVEWLSREESSPKRWRKKIKQEMIAAYGGVCICCGDAHSEFLTLDHIGGRTEQNHPWANQRNGTSIYGQLKKRGWPKDLYRLLCMNCNWAIRHGDTCPHQLSP